MEQNEQNGGTTEAGGTAETLTMDQVKKMIQETEKKWQSRFDQKNTELQKLRQEKMTDEERAKAEIAEERQRLEEERSAFQRERLKSLRTLGVTTKGLPGELADYIVGDDEVTIGKSVDRLKGILDAEVAKQVKARLMGTAETPIQGDPIDPTDDAAYMRAKFAKMAGGR